MGQNNYCLKRNTCIHTATLVLEAQYAGLLKGSVCKVTLKLGFCSLTFTRQNLEEEARRGANIMF